MGISAFTVGGMFSTVINSILPAIGALSLSGKGKEAAQDKEEQFEKVCIQHMSRVFQEKK